MEKPVEGYLDGRNIEIVAAMLRSGGVSVLPTDTIYGFHCVYSNRSSLDRIRRLKGRSGSAGFILLASSLEMVDGLVDDWPFGARDILGSLWPAPVTVILPASKKVPGTLRPEGGVAVRIPAMLSMIALIERTGEALVSTSANRSGLSPLRSIGDIRKTFPGLDAYISRKGGRVGGPSTVISLTGMEASIVRPGRSAEQAAAAFGID